MDVAFCPERIAEGHALEELHSLPQIVGADDRRAGDRAEALFRRLAPRRFDHEQGGRARQAVHEHLAYMKFAVANQFLAIADQAGVDYTNVLRAIREDYPRAADLPGPGFAAGPCLFKDTMQLAAFTADHFPLGQAAMQINEGLPAYIVSALERRHGTLRGRTVGILGMAFKAESDDIRASLSVQAAQAAPVGRGDRPGDRPVCDRRAPGGARGGARGGGYPDLGAPHREYRSLDLDGREVVDIWNATGGGIRL